MVQANKKLKKQQYVYDYDRRKTKKISNICLHLIKKLNDRSGGYIFARELKYEIERILNIRLSDKTIAKYRLKTLKMNFRRAHRRSRETTHRKRRNKNKISNDLQKNRGQH